MKHRLTSLLLVSVLGIGVLLGAWMPRDDDFFALRKNFEIFGALYENLVGEYVDPLDPEHVMRTGIEAMLADLDPYTTFIDEADRTEARLMQRGATGTVGLDVDRRGGQLTVIAPVEGTGAYRQGVQTGDVLLEVAGRPTAELSVRDVYSLLQGDSGTTVEVRVGREGEPEPLQFVLTREQVDRHDVSYAGFVEGDTARGLGYIKLDRFAQTAAAEVKQALESLQETGRLRGLVLDLRDNPGGLLEGAVAIADLFVPQGAMIVSMRGRAAQNERTYRSPRAPLAPDLPLVVLVNDYSASASEIVAGAVQDLDRGVIVGETTFGKGLVQTVKELPYNTGLKVTVAKYYTPSGRSIQSVDYGRHDGSAEAVPDSLRHTYETAGGRTVRDLQGIEPDVVAAPPEPGALEAALRRRAAFFFYANRYATSHDAPPSDDALRSTVLRDFEQWLEQDGFSYQSDADQQLDRLAHTLAQEGYSDALADEVAATRQALQATKADDFDRFAEPLVAELRRAILARYLDGRAQVEALMPHDPQILAAVEVLEDETRYRDILTAKGD